MNKINPTGLKGYEVTDRMKELMGIKPIVESKHTSVVELTKLGPDGKVYGIVRENHEYYIKTAENKANLVVEDFNYMGGLKNKKEFAYPSYAKATKHLNLKFNSLYESYGIEGKIDILKNDNLLKEDMGMMGQDMNIGESNLSECCGAPMYEGMCSECGMNMDEYNKDVMNRMKDQYGDKRGEGVYYATANAQDRNPENFEKNEGMMGETEGESPAATSSNVIDLSTGAIVGTHDYVKGFAPNDRGHQIGYRVSTSIPKGTRLQDEKPKQPSVDEIELSELDQAVFDMMEEKAPIKTKKAKLSIEKSLTDMDGIIEEFAPSKKKVFTIK